MNQTHVETSLVVEPMRSEDWPVVRRIYLEGIRTGVATFETTVPTWEVWDVARLPLGRLVARRRTGSTSAEVLGWAVLSPVSARAVYRGVAEVSVYVAEAARGQGVGKALLAALIRASEAGGIWTLQANIFPQNGASLALHERAGFRVVGVRERIGRLHGQWYDNVLLERRSTHVGG